MSRHAKLPRPHQGYYSRTEFALVGSSCVRMEAIMQSWADRLRDKYHCLLVTGDHADADTTATIRYDRKRFTPGTAHWNEYDDRFLGRQYDLTLVNGNHYPAARQIVFVDKDKAGTLERRKDQLSNVFGIVHVSGDLPAWLPDAPIVPIDRVDELLPCLEEELRSNTPPLKTLILAGGKSERMGQDKSQLVYRDGQTEIDRLVTLCKDLRLPVNISVREGEGTPDVDASFIQDRFLDLGPMGAICSAFLHDPNGAWLVLACDLPLLDRATVETLVEARQPSKVATALRSPEQEWPEPLVAIYEPRAYPRLLQFLSLGYSCPRKLLINSEVEVITLADAAPVTNANTPAERESVLQRLSGE